MFKLLKGLLKYKKIIPFIIILIAMQGIFMLMLPDYMSRLISEGIKSPAYEITQDGQRIKSIINPDNLDSSLQDALSGIFSVPEYQRTKQSYLFIDDNNNAVLVDGQGNLLQADEYGKIKGNPSYEKDENGNYIFDALTGERIPEYARTDGDGNIIYDSYIIADDKYFAQSTGYEIDNEQNIITAPLVTDIIIYDFENPPAPLLLDEYNNAEFLGFYTDTGNMPFFIQMGSTDMPALKFEREGESTQRFGTLNLTENGYARLKQVSYIPLITKYGLIMLGITFLISISAITANYFSSKVSMNLGKDIRNSLYDKINKFSLHDTGNFGTASLMTRTTNDVIQVQTLTFMIFRMVIMTPIMFAGGIIMALNKNAQMTLVLLFTIPVILILVLTVGKKVTVLFKSMQKKIDNLTLVARENLTGVRVIRAFNKEDFEDVRYNNANKDVTDTAIKANRIMSVMFPSIMFLMSITTLAVIAIAVISAKNNILGTTYAQFAEMMAVSQYIMQIMMSLLMIIMLFVLFPRASASAVRINEVLDTQIKIQNPKTPVKAIEEKGNITFNNVGFKFTGSEQPILSDIDLTIEGGQTISVIGGTGSGKSTLVSMIPRLFDVTQGSLEVDGVDVRKYNQTDLREKISFVPQKTLLFSGTIADNLKFGNENAGEEQMYKALETAQIKDFVINLPDKLLSVVEHGGVNFSGGQKQRLSIARAIIKKAQIYIFDDSFSSLDFKTDYNLRRALKRDLKNATVIIVSQRISTVMNSDNIIVLDEGRVAGTGKHKELLNSCKLYREIAHSQLSEEELQ